MKRHVSAENLARFRDGDLRPAAARRVAGHLDGCARCRETSAALAEVPALLAATEVPPIPAHLAARIEMALATESAHRAAGSPSMRTARPDPAGHTERTHRRSLLARRAPLPFPARRILAAAAVLVVVAGGYELVSHLPSRGSSSASSSSAGSPAARSPALNAPEAGPMVPGTAGAPVFGPVLKYSQGGHVATIKPERTTTNYQPARLAQQVSATLAAAPGAPVPGPSSSRGAAQQNAGNEAGFSAAQLTQLAGCVSRIAAGRTVLLVDVARFAGAPATVIVTGGPGTTGGSGTTGSPGTTGDKAWVVGPRCSRSASDILARQQIPGR